jgi:hypothetical protein
MDALTPERAALRPESSAMNTGGPRSGLPDSCTRPSHRSVANHLTRPSVAFARYPSAHWAPLHGSGFRPSIAGSPQRPAESRSSSCGPTVHLRLLSTPPRGDAVTFSYRPENVCLKRTYTSLIEYTLRRTIAGFCAGGVTHLRRQERAGRDAGSTLLPLARPTEDSFSNRTTAEVPPMKDWHTRLGRFQYFTLKTGANARAATMDTTKK